MRKIIPTEAQEQESLFQWAEIMQKQYPVLRRMYHIPNGGSRNKIEAANLKRQGVKSGVPDICLPVPRGKYHGLYIELKRTTGGKVSSAQSEWINDLSGYGYRALVCRGWMEAAKVIQNYLDEE